MGVLCASSVFCIINVGKSNAHGLNHSQMQLHTTAYELLKLFPDLMLGRIK